MIKQHACIHRCSGNSGSKDLVEDATVSLDTRDAPPTSEGPGSRHTRDTTKREHYEASTRSGPSAELRQSCNTITQSGPYLAPGHVSSDHDRRTKRRKKSGQNMSPPRPSSPQPSRRQLHSDSSTIPQRKKLAREEAQCLQPSTLDKLIIGIWEQIHGSVKFTLPRGVSAPSMYSARGPAILTIFT